MPTFKQPLYEQYFEGIELTEKLRQGPRIILDDGSVSFGYINSSLNLVHHRLLGPAFISHSGNVTWIIENKLHRDCGPAVIWPDGQKFWYKNAVEISQLVQFIETGITT